jgi:polyhydroxyalkanoate synthesis regulator phasin
MNNSSLLRAFFVGRAIAEVVYEQVEAGVTNALSELGKFDAEQRENLRNLVEDVLERAAREEEIAMQTRPTATTTTTVVDFAGTPSSDLQATIDDLRAEIAELRSELQRYRSRSEQS